MKKRVLFYSSYFYPETFRGNDIAFDLASKGYEVTVITNLPNYPLGCYFDGYSLFKRRKEVVNGVKVIRLPVIPRGSGSKKRIILNYGSELILMSIFSLFHSIFHKYDVIFIQQLSPATIAIPAIIAKSVQRIPIIYWLLDLWPESLIVTGIKNIKIISSLDRMMSYIYKRCDKILISSYGFKKALNKSDISDSKIEYFPNWGEDSLVNNLEFKRTIPNLPEGFKIMFAGNIGEAQNFENILQVALELKNRGYENVKWIIVGEGRKAQWIRDFIKNERLENNVFLMGRYPLEMMPSFFNHADCMLVSLKDELAFNLVMPAKVQAYMCCSKPILGMINGETAEVIKNANCGFCCDSNDIKGMVSTIIKMQTYKSEDLKSFGKNGNDYYNDNFKKELCMNKLNNILNNILIK